MKYQKKSIIIEAVQWTGKNISEICKFTKKDVSHLLSGGELYIETLEGILHASVGDYIIKGVSGEYYPCKPDIFEQVYDVIIPNAQPTSDPVKHGRWVEQKGNYNIREA